jgi:hypothetical protein
MLNMKYTKAILLIAAILVATIISCKTAGRIAARYWLKREIKEFVSNCDCSVDLVAEQYRNYQDAKDLSLTEIISFINKCK